MTQRLQDIDKIVVHHSASKQLTSIEEITQWHKTRGWLTVGYHYVIEFDGKIKVGRPLEMIPAAQKGQNTNSIAICITGDNTMNNWRWLPAQWRALEKLITSLYTVLGRKIEVSGHRDVLPGHTECPGLDIKDLLKDREGILV